MKKLFTLLALVWCAATGGWAQDSWTVPAEGTSIPALTKLLNTENIEALNTTTVSVNKNSDGAFQTSTYPTNVTFRGKGSVSSKANITDYTDWNKNSDNQTNIVLLPKKDGTFVGIVGVNAAKDIRIWDNTDGKEIYKGRIDAKGVAQVECELNKDHVYLFYTSGTTAALLKMTYEARSEEASAVVSKLSVNGEQATFDNATKTFSITFENGAEGSNLTLVPVAGTGATINYYSDQACSTSATPIMPALNSEATYYIKSVNTQANPSEIVYTLKVKNSVLYAVSFAKNIDGVHNVNRMFPADVTTTEIGTKMVLPNNYIYYKEGYTLIGWNDGANTYAPGDEYAISGNAQFTPVFKENEVSLDARGNDTEITVDFARKTNGGRFINIEGNADKVIFPATINGKTIDFAVDVNCNDGAAIEGSKGKLNNTSDETRAQMNKGTLITVPAAKNMVVKVYYTKAPKEGDIKTAVQFGGSDADEANTTDKYIQYTYTGTEATLNLVDQGMDIYPSKIVLLYPTKTKTPVITAGAFDFVKKGTPVTITAQSDATIKYSTDGGSTWQNYTEAIILKSAATVQAKASVEGLEDSEVAELTAGENVNASLPFVAVVYQQDYNADTENATMIKTLYAAMLNGYNTILVGAPDDRVAWETLCPTLDKADLVIITEAMSGGKTFSNSLKSIAEKAVAGEAKVINLKAFNYTSGRWNWGTPKNAEKEVVTVTPASKNYKLFNNCTYNADGTLTLFMNNPMIFNGDANHIQYVKLNADIQEQSTVFAYTADPANVVIHSIGDNYLFLGLSCDNFAATLPARTLVGNAVRMLIAGDKLDAINPIELPISSVGYATFCPEVDVTIPADAEAYIVTALPENDYVKLTPITGNIAKGEGVIVKGTAGAKVSFEGATAAATKSADNILVGTLEAKELTADEAYILVAQEGEAKFSLCSAGTIAAGKAYLPASGSAAPTLKFVFDDATFIQSVTEANGYELKANGAYNLAGQKVSAGYKGIVIKNGVKMIKK